MRTLRWLPALAAVLCSPVHGAEVKVSPMMLYVATDGNDAWSGKLAVPTAARTDGPFATLTRARDEIRKLKTAGPLPAGGITVELQPGVYELAATFELGAEDSGTPQCPITYRARAAKDTRLLGGRVVRGWEPVTDPAVLKRMDETARGNVFQADLKAQGIADLGKMDAGQTWGASAPGLEVFFGNEPMTLARWPNTGFVTIPQVLGPTVQDIRGTKGCMEGIFTYEGDRPVRWVGEKDIMLHGYWFWDWADQRLKVASIDTDKRVLALEPKPVHAFGFRKGMYYYAYNLLPELDQPGEWVVDRDRGKLYFWPPAPLAQEQVMVSVVPTLVRMSKVSYVTLRGLSFECTRGTALSIGGADHVQVAGCIIRNTGAWGVGMDGKESGLAGCDLYNLADGGITISGGDRRTLTPAGMYVDNCHFYRFGRWNPICKPAVSMQGVGNRMTHCLVNDAPHMAVMWGGNDHLFEFNEMHSVVRGANDAGIMYAGYNPTMRGHMIRHNYFHHVYGFQSKGCNGVYLDDMFCSATMYGNVFYQVPRAAFIGGGRDNVVENNIFVDCKPALHIDARMLGWASASVPTMKQRLEEMPYQDELWRTRFPQLLTYMDDEPAVPKGNVIARNVVWGGTWDEVEGKARPHVKFVDNLVNEDPRFVDAEKHNFQLREDSPAWKLGFQRIPLEKIGLYQDESRVTWPVLTEVRMPDPAPARPGVAAKPGPPPVFVVTRLPATVTVDGDLQPAEWGGLPAAQAMAIEQDLAGTKVKPASKAWLHHDGTALYVAIDNAVDPATELKLGDTWGGNDAVELAFKNPALGPAAPLLILRGYPSGHFAASDEAGAPPEAVKQAAEGVQYGAKVVDKGRWTAEWRVPFKSLGFDLTKLTRYPFSLSVRKTGGPEWVLWVGTNHATWNVDKAGFIELK